MILFRGLTEVGGMFWLNFVRSTMGVYTIVRSGGVGLYMHRVAAMAVFSCRFIQSGSNDI